MIVMKLVQKKFDRLYDPVSFEIDLKRIGKKRLEATLKPGTPKTTKARMERFYKQKALDILKLIYEHSGQLRQ